MKYNMTDLNKLHLDGYITVPYTFIQKFGIFYTCVLFQIISEYRHAWNKGLEIDNCFLTNLKRMADYLGITTHELKESLNRLEEYELISWYDSEIEDTIQIFVNIDNIVLFKQKLDEKQGFLKWDTGLISSQNPSWKKRNFAESTNAIINYVEEHFTKDISMAVYQRCNDLIVDYESDGSDFINDVPDIVDFLNKRMNSEHYGISLYCTIEYLCQKN